ncbi:MAG: type IV pilus twitching motility protein PilT [Bacillota bacterium]
MEFEDLLKIVSQDNQISDLHLTVFSPPYIRKNGQLRPCEQYDGELSIEDTEKLAKAMMTEDQYQEFKDKGELDFSYRIPGTSRFRVNAYHQRGSVGIALRIIPNEVPSIDAMGLPEVFKKLAYQRMGLVLSTGPTGSGKSTTQAAIINEINQNRQAHIMTLEDPIEYLHKHNKSLVHQREIGSDTDNFKRGLRACLRQDPDVILVGEMRDLETIQIALEAAETGHLVLATLHTNSAPATIDRIIDVFPAAQQDQIKIQLASVLSAVIAQQLVPTRDQSGRVAAFEIMMATSAIRNIIREGKTNQIYSAIQTGGRYSMITMDNSLLKLYQRGKITKESVLHHCNDVKYVNEKLR